MKRKGSMTVTMSLMLLILLSLVAAGLQASRIACGRVQVANAVDTGLYSLFSEYDQELLEQYHLFFLDGSYGTGIINGAQIINQIEHYMNPILSTGLTKGQVLACGIDGFRLASDKNGKAVQQQMIRYMKENIGISAIKELQARLESSKKIMKNQEQIKESGISEDIEETKPMEGISEQNNPLTIISNIRGNGFLDMVLPSGATVSEKKISQNTVPSKRELKTGTEEFLPSNSENTSLDKLWIQEYILKHMGNYVDQDVEGALNYKAEYILGGKDTDKENLSYVVNRLLLLREISNISYLYTDPQKRAELESCAAALSFLTLIPEGMVFVQAILAAGWAYIESLSDVRILLSGKKVPLMKDSSTWNTQLNHLQIQDTGSSARGLEYKDYLRILYSMSSKEKMVMRSLDIIELNLKILPGKEKFSIDACVDAMAFSFQIKGPEEKIWQADRIYTYDM